MVQIFFHTLASGTLYFKHCFFTMTLIIPVPGTVVYTQTVIQHLALILHAGNVSCIPGSVSPQLDLSNAYCCSSATCHAGKCNTWVRLKKTTFLIFTKTEASIPEWWETRLLGQIGGELIAIFLKISLIHVIIFLASFLNFYWMYWDDIV